MSPLALNAIAHALVVESSLQLTVPVMTRSPSLTVNTPFARPSWSRLDPSSDANELVPETVTPCAMANDGRKRAIRDSRSRTDRDRILPPWIPLRVKFRKWTMLKNASGASRGGCTCESLDLFLTLG